MRSLYGVSLIALTLVACGSDTPADGGTDSGTDASEATGNDNASGPGGESGQTTDSTTTEGSASTGDMTATVASSTGASGDETGDSTADESSTSATSDGPDTSEPTTTGVEPPPDTVIQGCNTAADYETSTYRTGRVGDTPVFAVGIHTDGSFGDSSSYEVEWALDGNGVLVLTGYEEAVWNVTVAAGASLSRVLVLSFEGATVNLAGSDAEVEIIDGFTDTAYAYPSLPASALIAFAERHLGLPVDGFDGCYEAQGAYIGETSTDQAPLPPPAVEPAECTNIRAESAYCLARGYDYRYTLLGLDSGNACTVGDEEDWDATIHDTFAAGAADEIILCDALEPNYYVGEATVASVALSTGQMQWTETNCGRIASVGTGFGVTAYNGTTFDVFDDYDAASTGVPSYSVENVASGRLAVHDDVLYAGSTTLQRYQLPGGAPLGPISLEGSPFIRGLSSALGSIVVYDDDVDSLRRFDPDDGTLLETIPLDFEIFFGGVDSIICFDTE